MSIVASIDAVIATLTEARADAVKVDAGKVGAPGTRVRKAAQEGRNALYELRKQVTEVRAAAAESAE